MGEVVFSELQHPSSYCDSFVRSCQGMCDKGCNVVKELVVVVRNVVGESINGYP